MSMLLAAAALGAAAPPSEGVRPNVGGAPPPASPWRHLRWCRTGAAADGSTAHCRSTCEAHMLRARFCERLVLPPEKSPCPEQWFAFLETTEKTWVANFPQCDEVSAIQTCTTFEATHRIASGSKMPTATA